MKTLLTLSINLTEPEKEILNRVSLLLLVGGIIIYPSDTVYGLLCRADNRESIKRLEHIKNYSTSRPFIVLVRNTDSALELFDEIPETAGKLMKKYWPGPLTIVCKAGKNCPEWVKSEDGTVAVRQPEDRISKSILQLTDVPMVTTSANYRKKTSPLNIEVIPDGILKAVDLVLNAGALSPAKPTTIVRVTTRKTEIIRQGNLKIHI